MHFKLTYTMEGQVANCDLDLRQPNTYVDRTLSDGRVISVPDQATMTILGSTTFSVNIPESENDHSRYINKSNEIKQAQAQLRANLAL